LLKTKKRAKPQQVSKGNIGWWELKAASIRATEKRGHWGGGSECLLKSEARDQRLTKSPSPKENGSKIGSRRRTAHFMQDTGNNARCRTFDVDKKFWEGIQKRKKSWSQIGHSVRMKEKFL